MIEYEDDNRVIPWWCKPPHRDVCVHQNRLMPSPFIYIFLSASLAWHFCTLDGSADETAVRQPIIQIVCNELIKQHIRWLHFAERSHFQWVHCNFSHLHILFSKLFCISPPRERQKNDMNRWWCLCAFQKHHHRCIRNITRSLSLSLSLLHSVFSA